MAVRIERTPNPAAMKFTVGTPVGGPATVTSPDDADPWAARILGIDGVASLFMTADFVTVTAEPSVSWDEISATIAGILEDEFT